MLLRGNDWDKAIEFWKITSITDSEAAYYDKKIKIKGSDIVPQVTWGTSPQDVAACYWPSIPDPKNIE